MYQPIVHWHTHWEKNQTIFQNYARQMDNFIQKVNSTQLTKTFKGVVKKVYGEKEAKQVLSLLNEIKNSGNSKFKKEIDIAYKKVLDSFKPYSKFNLTSQDFTDYKNNTSKKVKEINAYFENIDNAFTAIYNFYGSNFKNIEGFYRYYAGMMSDSELKSEVIEFFGNNNGLIQVDSREIQSLTSAARGSLKSLSKIKTNGYNPSQFSTGEEFTKMVKDFLNNQLGTLMGNIYEIFVASSQLQLDDVIIKYLGTNAKIEQSGGNRGSGALEYSTSTTDVKIIPGQGQVKISIPIGISVKKATTNKNGAVNLSVKETNLGKLLDILRVQTSLMPDETYEALLNLTTNFRKPTISKVDKTIRKTASAQDSHKTAFEYANMSALTLQLNKALLISGLAGSLSAKDLSTILIVNNKAFNIIDILRELGKRNNYENIQVSKGLTFSKIADVVKEHHFKVGPLSKELQKERSGEIEEKFKNIHMNLHLRLSKSLMAKLNKL